MSFLSATATLAAMAFTGLNQHYDMIELPGVVNEVDLPALVILPDDTYINAVAPYDANLSYGEVGVHIRHLLLIRGSGMGRIEDRYASLGTWISNYVDAISGDWYLSGNLVYPMAVETLEFGTVDYNGVLYDGIAFRHRWVLKV